MPEPFLRRLAEHAEWGGRRDVRLALATNPRTPVPQALRLVDGLGVADLKRLVNDDKVPTIVRIGASRTVERRTGGSEDPPHRRLPSIG